jgi:hypothetical protein
MTTDDYQEDNVPRFVGRCYSNARYMQNLIGRWPGGGQLPFGMVITLLQLCVGLGAFLALWKTMPWWKGIDQALIGGPIGYLVVMFGIPFALGVLLRKPRKEGRWIWQYGRGIHCYLRRRTSQASTESNEGRGRGQVAGRRIPVIDVPK